jgi:hypothetical protein
MIREARGGNSECYLSYSKMLPKKLGYTRVDAIKAFPL